MLSNWIEHRPLFSEVEWGINTQKVIMKTVGEGKNKMKWRWLFVIFLVLGVLWVNSIPCEAQSPVKSLTILYSNNINAEIEPCPT